MTGVRFRVETGWEGRCDVCLEWLPLDDTAEGWHPHTGYRRCAACRALWLRHFRLTGERLTSDQLAAAAKRERSRIRMRIVRGMPSEKRAPMSDAERSRRYRARKRGRAA